MESVGPAGKSNKIRGIGSVTVIQIVVGVLHIDPANALGLEEGGNPRVKEYGKGGQKPHNVYSQSSIPNTQICSGKSCSKEPVL